MERALKVFAILLFLAISLFGLVDLSINITLNLYVYHYDLRPLVYYYALIIVSALSAIQIARIIEGIASRDDVPFLLTTYFVMEDEPKKDPAKDPVAFVGLILLLLGGYLIRPAAFLVGLLRLLRHRNPAYVIALLNGAIVLRLAIILVFLPLGLILIEKRYVSRGSRAERGMRRCVS